VRLANYQIAFTQAQLRKLYNDKNDYQAKVQQRYDQLMKQGWALRSTDPSLLSDAAKVEFEPHLPYSERRQRRRRARGSGTRAVFRTIEMIP